MPAPYHLPEATETARLFLRRPRLSDAPALLAAYTQDPEVTRFLAWRPHDTLTDTEAFLDYVAALEAVGGATTLIAFAKDAPDQALGMVEAEVTDSRVRYGYVLKRAAWGQGYGSEILTHLLADALADPKIFRTEAFCAVENRASARVMEKAGMSREALVKRYLPLPNLGPEPFDAYLYAKTR